MDKFEYKIKADEIKELIARQEYEQAAEIADSIDWRRVKSVMMLCTVSDLYKMCRRYEDSRDMLLLAYERHPGGRTILYSLCELSIKMEEFVQAVEYFKEYVQIAPKDTGRYILQYKLYEAQDVSLEERIAVLEDMKKREYREKWAYELAYLYHRVGLATKCVEECDELVLWFGAGKYVSKALELKMLHAPLTPEQQYKYDQRFEGNGNGSGNNGRLNDGDSAVKSTTADGMVEAENTTASATDTPVEELDIQVKTYDVGQYDTINLQEELAAGIQEYFGTVKEDPITRSIVAPMMNTDTIDLSATAQKVNKAMSDSEQAKAEVPEAEVYFGETGEIHQTQQGVLPLQELTVGEAADLAAWNDGMQEEASEESSKEQERGMLYTQPPKEMAGVLSMDADGQISFVLPQRDPVEKQITGQISINDIILEWERLKKENAEKRKEEIRQRVLQQTGAMFSEFDAAAKDGLLEQLEQDREIPVTATKPSKEETVIADFTEDLGEVEELIEIAEVAEVTEDMESPAEEEVSEDVFAQEYEVESTEEIAEEIAEQVAVESEAKLAEEVAEDVAEEAVEEAAGEVAEEPEAEATEENSEETAEEVAEEPEAELVAELVEETEEEAEEAVEKLTEEAAEEPEAEVTEENSEEPAEEVTEELEAEPAAEVETAEVETEEEAEEAVEKLTEEAAEKPEAETTEENSEETAEEAAEKITGESSQAHNSREQSVETVEKHKVRNLTRDERELYGQYIQGRSSKEQLIKAIDNISMAAYTGNVIVTGDDGMDPMGLAKNIIREVQMTDSNFSGKIAKISGDSLNSRDVKQIIDDLDNGALIIQKAALMKEETAHSLYRSLQPENKGIVVVLVDTKKHINRFLEQNEKLLQCFTARVDIAALSNDALVLFARKYAREKEYSIDELGLLALHTRIADMQTSEHSVTILDVKEIMDEAIESANRKTIGHFFDIVFARRYDDDDMIILKEKDFI